MSWTYISPRLINELLLVQADTLTATDMSKGLMMCHILSMIWKVISSFSARYVLDTNLMDLPSALTATDALVICELPGKPRYPVLGLHAFGP